MSTCCLSQELALFQQNVDNAGSVDGRPHSLMQDFKVAQSAKDYTATVSLQHRFGFQVACNADVEMFSVTASHDKDVIPESRGVMLQDTVVQRQRPILQLGYVQKFCQKR